MQKSRNYCATRFFFLFLTRLFCSLLLSPLSRSFPSLANLSLSSRLNVQKHLRQSTTRSILIAYHPQLTELYPYSYPYLTEPLGRSIGSVSSRYVAISSLHLYANSDTSIADRSSWYLSIVVILLGKNRERNFPFIEELKLREFL